MTRLSKTARRRAVAGLFGLALALIAPWLVAVAQEAEPSTAGAATETASPEEVAPEEAESTETEPAPAAEAADSPPLVLRMAVDSAIHPVAAEFVIESLATADERRAAALVIELNTPGGLLSSTREITKAMLSARTPVVVYVAPAGAQAGSAGFFILMAADVAAMAPGSNAGAAHPVSGQGEDIEGDMGKKVEEDSAANVRSLARQQGRNVEAAEAAVLESESYTAEEALELGLIDLVAPSFYQLLEAIDGTAVKKVGEEPVALATAGATVEELEMPLFRRFLSTLSHPAIATILMALGMLGLYMELSNPGAILPGVVGAICLILGFYAMSVLPLNYAGVALLLLALVLFIAETQVPTFGLLTTAGAISLVLGVVMLFKDVEPWMRTGMELIVATVAGMLVVIVLLTTRALKVRGSKVTTGKEGLVGERGVVRTALDPKGKVFVHGELWSAVADGTKDDAVVVGTPVEVTAVEGMLLRVREVH